MVNYLELEWHIFVSGKNKRVTKPKKCLGCFFSFCFLGCPAAVGGDDGGEDVDAWNRTQCLDPRQEVRATCGVVWCGAVMVVVVVCGAMCGAM